MKKTAASASSISILTLQLQQDTQSLRYSNKSNMTRVQVAIILVAVIAVCSAARMRSAKKDALQALMQANSLLRNLAAGKHARQQGIVELAEKVYAPAAPYVAEFAPEVDPLIQPLVDELGEDKVVVLVRAILEKTGVLPSEGQE